MGLVYAEIELANARDDALAPMTLRAMVDSGALHLSIPEAVRLQLGLARLDQRSVTVSDGRQQLVDYVGPLRVRFGNRQCLTGAIVLGDQPLLGAIPMEDMDVLIDPARQALVPNPRSPNIPASLAMGVRASLPSE
jgi:clan AA aspartic protease